MNMTTKPTPADIFMRLCETCSTTRLMMHVLAILGKLPHEVAAFVMDSCTFACNPQNPAYAKGLHVWFLTSQPHLWVLIVPDDADLLMCMEQLPGMIAIAWEQHADLAASNEVLMRRAEQRVVSWRLDRAGS